MGSRRGVVEPWEGKKLAWAFRSTGAQPTPVVSLLWTILDESFDAHDTVHREMERPRSD